MKNLTKTTLLMSLLCLIHHKAAAQINLVQNGSFEDYYLCPSTNGEVENCVGWYSAANSPDYINECAPALPISGVSIPNNNWGFQYAYDGKAYMGFYIFSVDEYREPIRGSLSQTLAIGTKYYVSLKVSLAEKRTKYAINKIGVLFTNLEYTSLTNPLPPATNYAHIYTNNIITDTADWTTIGGSFIADSSYKYIMIGNFFENIQTSAIVLDSLSSETSYYFIDDVCVSVDSIDCYQFLEPSFVLPNAFTPNGDNINDLYRPFPESVHMQLFRIYNRWGQKIYEVMDTNAAWDGKFNGEPQPSDVYAFYLEVKNRKTGKLEHSSGSFTLLR